VRRPAEAGAPIDSRRVRDWVAEYSSYRLPVTETRIDRWLSQFDLVDQDLAARCLDAVDFVPGEQITALFRDAYASLRQRFRHEPGAKWRFVPYSVSAGESGDSMLARFRHANNMAGERFKPQFIYKSELLTAGLTARDKIVFVDDFSGTGEQVCSAWKQGLRELVPEGPRPFLLLITATPAARSRIERETPLEVVSGFELNHRDNLFHPSCTYFSEAEKKILLKYCETVKPDEPRGHGDCGLLLAFAHTCPNNSIPILHARTKEWDGLFRRYD
jgi:hypothetical protein